MTTMTSKTDSTPERLSGRLPEREIQALREVGRTEISRPAAVLLATLFLATLLAVPMLRSWSGGGSTASDRIPSMAPCSPM